MNFENQSKEELIKELQTMQTEYTKLKKQLQEKNEKYKQLVQNSPAGIYEIDLENMRFINVNDFMCGLLGYTKEEFLSLNPFDILPDEGKLHFHNRLKKIYAGQQISEKTEYKILGKNGQELWLIIHAKHTYNNEGKPVKSTVVAHDITERKNMEEQIKQSEMMYRTIFENTGCATIIIETDTTISLANAEFEKISGYSKEEIEGKLSFKQFINSRDLNKMLHYHYKRRTNPENVPRKYDFQLIDREGHLKDVLMTVALIPCTQKSVASLLDITEFKKFEAEMARLERLNLLGQMAAGIAHELRNPMTTIRGFLQMFTGISEFSKYKDYFSLMIEELDRANSILEEFLSLARKKQVNLKKQNLNYVINKIFPLIQADTYRLGMNVTMHEGDIPEILLNEQEICQLILNLTRNGLEAMSPGGNLNIKTYHDTFNNEIVLEVEDEGSGINPNNLDKLGQPFFTTKNNGTGLGLAVCYSIADRHNASMRIKNNNKGTTVSVHFGLN